MKWEGEFTPEGKDERWSYVLDSWVDQHHYRHEGDDISVHSLKHIDWATFECVNRADPSHSYYVTLYGPWEEMDDILWDLEYDFGEEGSLRSLAT